MMLVNIKSGESFHKRIRSVFQLSKYISEHIPFYDRREFYDLYIITMMTVILMSVADLQPKYIKVLSILYS